MDLDTIPLTCIVTSMYGLLQTDDYGRLEHECVDTGAANLCRSQC